MDRRNNPPDAPVHGVIYGLHDPVTGELRYIGQTVKSVSQRLATHLSPSSLRRHSYLYRWLKGLVERGLKPSWSQIAEAEDQTELDLLEVLSIAEARASGTRLVNLSNGGGGRAGYVPSTEEREKIAVKQRGVPRKKHTPEWRARMAKVMAGRRTNTPEHMEHLRQMKLGVPRSPGTKAKISEAKKGCSSHMMGKHHTAVTKARISANRTGRLLGATHHQYRHDISTADILERLGQGATKVAIARELGVSPTFVHRRLAQALRVQP